MIKVDGKKVASQIIESLKKQKVPKKFMAAFVVSNNPATESFVRQKEKLAKELGVDFRTYKFDSTLTNDELRKKIHQIVSSNMCGAAILQLPLPEKLSSRYIANAIPSEKDVDVLSEKAAGEFYSGKAKILPPSVLATMEILKEVGEDITADKKIAVVGLGTLVGKPISVSFYGKVREIFALDKGSDFSILKEADVVILGTGNAGLIKASMIKKGAGVIDFGYGLNGQGKVAGDFDVESISDVGENYLSFYTPTPGGTGPVLVACLFENFYSLSG